MSFWFSQKTNVRGKNGIGVSRDGLELKSSRSRKKNESSEQGRSLSILAEDFLYCGSTALFLLIADLFPAYWYFSFIALLPFLWRVSKASPAEALRLGLLLGVTFFSFSSLDALLVAPVTRILKVFCGTLLFALWGWGVGLARQYLGFNPVIVAGLWVFFELALINLGYTTGLLAYSTPSDSFALRILTLFGFGVISFLVVLLNSVLVRVVEYAVKVFKARAVEFSSKEPLVDPTVESIFVPQKFFLVPQLRGPPCLEFGVMYP